MPRESTDIEIYGMQGILPHVLAGHYGVEGDSLNSSLVGIISDVMRDWPEYQGIKVVCGQYNDFAQLCNDLRAKAAVLSEMDAVARDAQLRGFEFAKAVTLVAEPFSVENGLLTPTFKVSKMGVTSILVNNGVTLGAFKQGLTEFSQDPSPSSSNRDKKK